MDASIIQAHDETVFDADLHCGGQTVDTSLDSIMNMLINIYINSPPDYRRGHATEECRDGCYTHHNPSTTHARACHQQSPRVLDLS